jgi:release factor glutamine methyltransferase
MLSETIGEAIAQGLKNIPPQDGNQTQDLQVLMAQMLGKEKTWVITHSEQVLSAEEQERWEAALGTYASGVPLPYVIGEWEFYGLKFKVTPAVLIPRPETELLVETGLSWLKTNPTRRRGLDVGTGSGCILIALASHLPDLEMLATDISAEALEVAKFNVQKHGLTSRIRLMQMNLLEGIQESFDFICSNLPYIPNERLPRLEVSKWEPRVALGGGPDGLQFIKPFLHQASAKLNPAGLVLAEIDGALENQVKELAEAIWPNAKIEIRKDLAGLPRLLVVETI